MLRQESTIIDEDVQEDKKYPFVSPFLLNDNTLEANKKKAMN